MGLNLIIDGNYFFYKTLFIFGSYQKDPYGGGSTNKVLESKKEQEMFIRKLAMDLCHVIRVFGNPYRIIFTIDSRSWRKDIEIEDGSYKGNREEKSVEIDWTSFYACMGEFAEVLKNHNIIISKEEKAEGDDLMYLWANQLLEMGNDSVIITGDRDLNQCISFNGKNFVIAYNPNSKNEKVTAPLGFSAWLKNEEYDLFDASTYMNRTKDVISEVLTSVPIDEKDPKYLIFEKVITGDAGDAVPSIWTWEKGGKTYRVTPAKASRMYEILNLSKPVTDVFDLPNRSEEIAKAIEATCKQTPASSVIKSRLERNLKLVYLDKRIIPTSIQEKFSLSFEDKAVAKQLSSKIYDMNALLEGTRFISEGKTFEADIFSQFK